MPVELILGGARSGKSRAAEQRAAAGGLGVTVIVTAAAATRVTLMVAGLPVEIRTGA